MTYSSLARLVLLGAIWGASFLFMRIAVPAFGPPALIELRLLAAAVLLALVAAATGRSLDWKRHWLHFPALIFPEPRDIGGTTAYGDVIVTANRITGAERIDTSRAIPLSTSETWALTAHSAHYASALGDAAAYYWVRDGKWRGINGKWNSMSWGGNGATGARSIVVSGAKALGTAGKALGAYSVLVTAGLAVNAASEGDWRALSQYVADGAVGVLVVTTGPVGLAFGVVYFASRTQGDAYDAYTWITGK